MFPLYTGEELPVHPGCQHHHWKDLPVPLVLVSICSCSPVLVIIEVPVPLALARSCSFSSSSGEYWFLFLWFWWVVVPIPLVPASRGSCCSGFGDDGFLLHWFWWVVISFPLALWWAVPVPLVLVSSGSYSPGSGLLSEYLDLSGNCPECFYKSLQLWSCFIRKFSYCNSTQLQPLQIQFLACSVLMTFLWRVSTCRCRFLVALLSVMVKRHFDAGTSCSPSSALPPSSTTLSCSLGRRTFSGVRKKNYLSPKSLIFVWYCSVRIKKMVSSFQHEIESKPGWKKPLLFDVNFGGQWIVLVLVKAIEWFLSLQWVWYYSQSLPSVRHQVWEGERQEEVHAWYQSSKYNKETLGNKLFVKM